MSMRSQVLSQQSSLAPQAFAALLRAYVAATRRLNAQLVEDHGLTISDYEVLLRLAQAPERRLRRVDLAEQVLLSPSGVTRLLDGLEEAGFVARASCSGDRRVVYAVLTDAGLAALEAASTSHLAQVEELFGEQFADEELATVTELLSRVGDHASDLDCGVPR